MPVATKSKPPEVQSANDTVVETARQTLSELVARILDQLSLSAWLPAGILVFGVLLIGSLKAKDGHVGKALTALGHLSAAGLILLVVAVVLSTVLTQAFQFESIRLLEGYWGPGGLWTRIADRRCERHLDRRDDIYKRLDETTTAAFEQASAQMLAEGVPPRVVAAHSRVLRKETTAEQLPATQRRDVERFPWRAYAPIRLLRRIESLDVASHCWPR